MSYGTLQAKKDLYKRLKADRYYPAGSWPEFNRAFFDGLASKYDATCVVHSFGQKKWIDRKAVSALAVPPGSLVLDLCAGTGDICIPLARQRPDCRIIAADYSEKMLETGRRKARDLPLITWQLEDAMHMSFPDEHFDAVITSFGLRNLTDIREGLREIRRVLKPGGCFVNIDQGKPSNPLIKLVYKAYFFHLAPLLGKVMFHIGEFNSFRYLPYSNLYFPDQAELCSIFAQEGFVDVRNHDEIFGAVAWQVMRRSDSGGRER